GDALQCTLALNSRVVAATRSIRAVKVTGRPRIVSLTTSTPSTSKGVDASLQSHESSIACKRETRVGGTDATGDPHKFETGFGNGDAGLRRVGQVVGDLEHRDRPVTHRLHREERVVAEDQGPFAAAVVKLVVSLLHEVPFAVASDRQARGADELVD